MSRIVILSVFLWFVAPGELKSQSASYSLKVDNDIFNLFNQTDRYYTSGISALAFHQNLNKSPVNTLLIGNGEQENSRLTGIFITQRIYTPTDIYTDALLKGDRPYASYLLVGQQLISVNSSFNYRIKSGIGLGLLGKFSGGESLQNFIHGLTPHSENANGWQHQIKHDFLIDYSLQLEKGLVNLSGLQLNSLGKIQVGTLVNRADIGVEIHSGLFEDYFSKPLINSGSRNFSIRFFGNVNLAYVFYDATLQGGLVNSTNVYAINSKQLTKERINYQFGLQLSVKQFVLLVGRTWETHEFAGAKDHAWGYITIQYIIQ